MVPGWLFHKVLFRRGEKKKVFRVESWKERRRELLYIYGSTQTHNSLWGWGVEKRNSFYDFFFHSTFFVFLLLIPEFIFISPFPSTARVSPTFSLYLYSFFTFTLFVLPGFKLKHSTHFIFLRAVFHTIYVILGESLQPSFKRMYLTMFIFCHSMWIEFTTI